MRAGGGMMSIRLMRTSSWWWRRPKRRSNDSDDDGECVELERWSTMCRMACSWPLAFDGSFDDQPDLKFNGEDSFT